MEKVLEKDINQMFQVTAALLAENPLSLKKAAAIQQVSVKTIRRLMAGQLNESCYFDYRINSGKITNFRFTSALPRNQHELIADLFHKSANLALLILSMKQPILTFPMLSHAAYISPSTLHRRFTSFARFLSPYLITIDHSAYPIITGNERQIRFLLFKLTAFLLPNLYASPLSLYQHFHDIHTLRQTAFYSFRSCTTTEEIVPSCFVPDYYLVNESAYLFLWKQLLAQETFFVPKKEAILLTRIIHPLFTEREDHSLADRLSQIYQVHLLCALLEGNIFVFQPAVFSFSKTTIKLIRSFLLQLPHYEKLLKKHPELPLLYECIWQKHSIFQPIITIKNARS